MRRSPGIFGRIGSALRILRALNSLAEDTTPDATADFVLCWDASAQEVKKVKINNLLANNGTISGGSF